VQQAIIVGEPDVWILLLLLGFLALLYGGALMPVLIAPALVVLILGFCIFGR
jgi:hypothetical protein